MADRAELTRITAHVLTGQMGVLQSSKNVAYLLLEPGDDLTEADRQGCVFSNITRPE